MDYLETVNKVLVRLREDAASSVSDTAYTLLIGEFVQQATSEVEDAWEWNALRTTITVTTVASTTSYALTGAGSSFSIEYVFNDTDDAELRKAPSARWMTRRLLDNNAVDDTPGHYIVNGVNAGLDPLVDLYPVPDAVYSINFTVKVKTVLSADTDETPVPWLPIVLKAYLLAINERGDDSGVSAQAIQGQFDNALANATAFDVRLNEDEGIWEVE